MDMVEFGVQEFKGLHEFVTDKIAAGTKPCLLFSGAIFEHDPDMKRIKSLMIDFFRGPVVTHIRLAGLEHALQVIIQYSTTFAKLKVIHALKFISHYFGSLPFQIHQF
jgi:ribosome production factor 2